MLSLTPLIRNIIFICVGVFLAQTFLANLYVTEYLQLYKIGTPYFRPYQLFTYMFAHGSMSHIFFNMLTLAFMGPALEMVWGQQRLLLYYIATGVGAGLIYVGVEYFLNPVGGGAMLGASGAIYGLLMGYGLMMPDREIQLMLPPISIKAKYLVFVVGGITYAFDRSGTVAHLAHFGGAFVGFLMIKVFKF
ncbi:MAG TPA: rhomboid family intramembrane serine protease [Cyclobacteriaceae bacterium]|nr:rhomboid family intramembrane serine protease [Cyclobacteriaceae bacterium]